MPEPTNGTQIPLIVLIPTHGHQTEIVETLQSLAQCKLPDSYAKTIIVENGPERHAQQLVAQASSSCPHLNIEYQHVALANKSNALNIILQSLKENSLIFFTDDDIRFDNTILLKYSEAALGITEHIVFGGVVNVNSTGSLPEHLRHAMPVSMTGHRDKNARRRSYFLGANYAAFSDDIRKLGGFDIRFGPGSELMASGNESSMMRSMRSAGFEFRFLPDAIVWHSVNYDDMTEHTIIKRRYRAGVERGIRLCIQYEDKQKSGSTSFIPVKIFLSKLLKPLNTLWSTRGYPAHTRINAACQAAYHRGIVKGWSHTIAKT